MLEDEDWCVKPVQPPPEKASEDGEEGVHRLVNTRKDIHCPLFSCRPWPKGSFHVVLLSMPVAGAAYAGPPTAVDGASVDWRPIR